MKHYFEVKTIFSDGEKIVIVLIDGRMKDYFPRIVVVEGIPKVFNPGHKEFFDNDNDLIFFAPSNMDDQELDQARKEIAPVVLSKKTQWMYLDSIRTNKRPVGKEFKDKPVKS